MKKLISGILILILTTGAVTGCGSTRNQTGGAGENKVNPKGRYVEHVIDLPFEESEGNILAVNQSNEGKLEIIAEDRQGKKALFKYDGTEWEKKDVEYFNRLGEGDYITNIVYGDEGDVWFVYFDQSFESHLVRVDKNLDETALGEEWLKNDMVISLDTGKNGDIFVGLVSGKHLCLTREGKVKYELFQSTGKTGAVVTKNSYIVDGEKGMVRYDMETGEEQEVVPYQSESFYSYSVLAPGTENDFYLCNSDGIHHIEENGTIWETVIDGSLNSLSMPAITVDTFFRGQEGDFYVWYREENGNYLTRYTYDSDMPSVPSQTLTIYGLNLSANPTIRQAASIFQMKNPDVKVELIDGNNYAGGSSTTDIIRSLNTELLNGNGADILVLDGLPVKSYIEKGILEDLSDMIQPLQQEGVLYENLIKPLWKNDNKIYQVPVRIKYPLIYGEGDALSHLDSLSSINQYLTKYPDQPIMPKTIYENILRQYIELYYSELTGEEGGNISTEKLELLLDTAKKTGDACGAKVKFDPSEDGGNGEMYNQIRENTSGMTPTIYMGSQDLSTVFETPGGMVDLIMPFASIAEKQFTLLQLNGDYYPQSVLGITKQSEKKEIAKEFMKLVLSEEIQNNDLSDGFPVTHAGIQGWKERDKEIVMMISDDSMENMMEAGYPNKTQRETVLSFVEGLKNPVEVDRILEEMIIDESRGYFEGTQTIGEAVKAVEAKINLYMAQ